jgi:DNA (cytosine-5)-methyltransferase 1
MQTPFTHGSLFSGIGGFDLAAEWMGWENRFHCEWNPFGQRVLKYYWPNAESFHDITKTDFTKYAHAIDLISGGFPCQPYSSAGKRLGKEDERHLWPHMLRAIREVSPRYVVGENVRGLTNWNGGVVFDEVQADLEAEGYEVLPFLLPACGVGAPHRRDRIWFIAHTQNSGRDATPATQSRKYQKLPWEAGGFYSDGNATYPECFGQSRQGWSQRQVYTEEYGDWEASWVNPDGRWPTVTPVCTGNDGIPAGLDLNAISFGKWRQESVKAAGNAIVPQVALQIFLAIAAYESLPSQKL